MIVNTEPHTFSACGKRPSNEDVEQYKLNLTADGRIVDPNFAPADFFVICDGHGGNEVAEYIAPKLLKFLMKKELVYPLKHKYIIKVYDHLQKKLIELGIAKQCGCTALVTAIYLDSRNVRNVQIINIGDCRAVISKSGLANSLSIDHKPSWPDEKKRIDKVNSDLGLNKKIWLDVYTDNKGNVIGEDYRIGTLSVSRAFGDIVDTPHVTHIPDIFNYQLSTKDEFIVMACDGVWDVLGNEEVVNFVRDHRTNNHIKMYDNPYNPFKGSVDRESSDSRFKYPPQKFKNSKNIAEKLALYAIAKGSTDNVSVIIIFLN